MLYRITRPEEDGGGFKKMLHLRGGVFAMTRGQSIDIELSGDQARELARDGYQITKSEPPAGDAQPAAFTLPESEES